MFLDLHNLDQSPIESDLCIIGAGPAGISIALAFAGKPIRVCLLESGGFKLEKHTQSLCRGEVAGLPLDVFIAGDDAIAKEKVAQIVTDGGMRPIDAGPLSRARQIEGMQLLHIVIQGTLGTNWGSTVKVLS